MVFRRNKGKKDKKQENTDLMEEIQKPAVDAEKEIKAKEKDADLLKTEKDEPSTTDISGIKDTEVKEKVAIKRKGRQPASGSKNQKTSIEEEKKEADSVTESSVNEVTEVEEKVGRKRKGKEAAFNSKKQKVSAEETAEENSTTKSTDKQAVDAEKEIKAKEKDADLLKTEKDEPSTTDISGIKETIVEVKIEVGVKKKGRQPTSNSKNLEMSSDEEKKEENSNTESSVKQEPEVEEKVGVKKKGRQPTSNTKNQKMSSEEEKKEENSNTESNVKQVTEVEEKVGRKRKGKEPAFNSKKQKVSAEETAEENSTTKSTDKQETTINVETKKSSRLAGKKKVSFAKPSENKVLSGKRGTQDKGTRRKQSGKKEVPRKKQDNVYEVEKIINMRQKNKGERHFLVRWKGYSSQDDTWEPEKNLNLSKKLIAAFLAKDQAQQNGHSKTKNQKKVIQKGDKKITKAKEIIYEVEKIIDVKDKYGRREFLVRWKGYQAKDDTWVSEANMSCENLITEYFDQFKVPMKTTMTKSGRQIKQKMIV